MSLHKRREFLELYYQNEQDHQEKQDQMSLQDNNARENFLEFWTKVAKINDTKSLLLAFFISLGARIKLSFDHML